MDCDARRVSIKGKDINLTAKEFDVLELLVLNPNKVYSRENLLNLSGAMIIRGMSAQSMSISDGCVRRSRRTLPIRSMSTPSGVSDTTSLTKKTRKAA